MTMPINQRIQEAKSTPEGKQNRPVGEKHRRGIHKREEGLQGGVALREMEAPRRVKCAVAVSVRDAHAFDASRMGRIP